MRSVSPEPEAGRSAKGLEVLRLVRESERPLTLDRAMAARWKLRQRIAQVTTPRPRRASPFAWGFAATAVVSAVALAIVAVVDFGGGREEPSVAALEAPRLPRAADVVAASGARPAWSEVNLPDLGEMELSLGDAFEIHELSSERQLRISSGTLRAHMVRQDPERPVVVVTPHLRLVVVGTRFDVRVDSRRTMLEVLEGAVRAEALGGAAVLVTGGSSIGSDDPRLDGVVRASERPAGPGPSNLGERHAEAARPASAARSGKARLPVEASCETITSPPGQRACFERVARGRDLAAQNALYTLGVIARDVENHADAAIDLFHAYAHRFPTGLLAPEAALAALDLLQRQGRIDEAIADSVEFERRFATDVRAPEVTLVRAELLCREPAQRAEALGLIERVVRGNPGAAGLAARARARCQPADAP